MGLAPSHPVLGHDVSSFVPAVSAAVTLSDSFPEEFPPGMVTIDFTAPANTLDRLEWNASKGVGAVIGTTGFEAVEMEQIGKLAAQSPILLAPNMSVGVNVMFALLAEGLKMLGDDFDVEISEIHHRFKKDAPSGTARRLAEV